ncbi:hypothetical protein V6403_18085, partial [Acinetobacter baumannii]
MNIFIRDEREEDIKEIEELTKAAFLNAEHTSHTEHFIVALLHKDLKVKTSHIYSNLSDNSGM